MGGRGHSQTKIFYFLVDKKHREQAVSTGTFVVMRAWEP